MSSNTSNLTLEATYLYLSTNSSTDPPVTIFKICWAYVTITICGCGITAYIFVCRILVKYRQKNFRNSFYTLCLSLAIPDCLTTLSQIIYSIPAVLMGERFMSIWYRQIVGYIADISWFVLSAHMVMISVNRLVAVAMLSQYEKIFNPKVVRCVLVGCYVYGVALTSLMYACTCEYHFPTFTWLFECEKDSACAVFSITANATVSNFLTVIVVVIYVIIFIMVQVNKSRVGDTGHQERKQARKELALVVQFGVICTFLVIYVLSFWIVPPLVKWGVINGDFGTALINTFCILNSSINPFLYIIYGTEFRRVTLEHFTPKSKGHNGGGASSWVGGAVTSRVSTVSRSLTDVPNRGVVARKGSGSSSIYPTNPFSKL